MIEIPQGFSLAEISVTLIDKADMHTIKLQTEDEGGGAYLRLEIDGGTEGFFVTVEELESIAALGRRLVTLADGT
jgi:hypothetical protein